MKRAEGGEIPTRPVCRCGQTFILAGVLSTGHVWAYCSHCDRPHQPTPGNATCANCAAYARALRGVYQL